MDDITFIYEKFKSISIRGDFEIDDDVFEGIKICFNPNFWPHSFNFKSLDNFKKNKQIKRNRLDEKWNKSLKLLNEKLSYSKLSIHEKKEIFIDWVKTNNDLWNEIMELRKIHDYSDKKLNAWKTLILFLNKYNEQKSNIIKDKEIFSLYKTKGRDKSNYNSDYFLVINDLYNPNSKYRIIIFCVKSDLNDLNKKLISNPTKYKGLINYLYLTFKSIQIRNNYHFEKYKNLTFSNIFLNEKKSPIKIYRRLQQLMEMLRTKFDITR